MHRDTRDDLEFVEPDEMEPSRAESVDIEIDLGDDATEPGFRPELEELPREPKTDVDVPPAHDPGFLAALDIIQAFRRLTATRRSAARPPRSAPAARTPARLPPLPRPRR